MEIIDEHIRCRPEKELDAVTGHEGKSRAKVITQAKDFQEAVRRDAIEGTEEGGSVSGAASSPASSSCTRLDKVAARSRNQAVEETVPIPLREFQVCKPSLDLMDAPRSMADSLKLLLNPNTLRYVAATSVASNIPGARAANIDHVEDPGDSMSGVAIVALTILTCLAIQAFAASAARPERFQGRWSYAAFVVHRVATILSAVGATLQWASSGVMELTG